MSKKRVEVVAYLRTSSATNVGADKDSDKRQRDAIQAFVRSAGYVIVDEFYDAAVKGADPLQERPGFAALLERIRGNGVRTIKILRPRWISPARPRDRALAVLTVGLPYRDVGVVRAATQPRRMEDKKRGVHPLFIGGSAQSRLCD